MTITFIILALVTLAGAIAAMTSISMDPLDPAMRVRPVFIECECSQPG